MFPGPASPSPTPYTPAYRARSIISLQVGHGLAPRRLSKRGFTVSLWKPKIWPSTHKFDMVTLVFLKID